MYVRAFERSGQAQHLEEQNAKPLLSLLSGSDLPQGILKRAGLKTTTRVDSKTAHLIQSVLEQSHVLGLFIAAKLKTTTVARNFILHGFDATFDHAYLKLHKIVIPFGSKEEKELINIRGFYHHPTDSIHVRPSTNIGQVLQLAIRKFSSPAFRNFFGESLEDGLSLYFANLVLGEQGLAQMRPETYKDRLSCAETLVGLVGRSLAGQAYFQNPSDLVRHLTTNLSIGPVRPDELVGNALCKTTLLSAARLASNQVEKMVAVGAIGPRSVRLWMRTNDLRPHELHIAPFGDPRGAKTVTIRIPPGPHGDNTFAFTYPDSFNAPPLDPLRRYSYRIVQTSDGTPLGQGFFETAPARDADTPDRVVIAVMSCHQPFTSQGTIDEVSARMLRLIPRILQENCVKFVLLCGDQIYADEPGALSLLSNRYLIRRICPGKTSILECSPDEVRRVYDTRYRIFWSMPPIRAMYAKYPCYPAMDDHEIMDDWGSLPDHASPRYRNLWHGARLAYYDYQALRILRPTPQFLSFHYSFNYGNIGVFVMDIRSERIAGSPNQLYSDAQLDDLRQFLRDNGAKKVLLIVTSVPVVHLAGWLADFGEKVINPVGRLLTNSEVDFPDQWSFKKNLPARNAFLSLLHEHQQAHPKQRVAIVSGDVHIGNAFSIHWQGGNKPRLYQFTSSAISMRLKGFKATLSKVGPRSVSDIKCPPTQNGGPCSGRVRLLPAAKEAASRNPFSGLNLGLIEVHRYGDVSNLRFKLIGCHPREERPVTYFESGYLG